MAEHAHLPALADAPYVIGLGRRGRLHAVTYLEARAAMDEVLTLERRSPLALPVCAELSGAVLVAARYGEFSRANPRLAPGGGLQVCAVCAWTVAIRRGQVEPELAALTATGSDRWVLRRDGIDPGYLPGLCRAILTHASPGADEPYGEQHAVALLAHATRHAPRVFVAQACLDDSCDHAPADLPLDEPWHCPRTQDASVLCGACSLTGGPWAGEFEGLSLAEVIAPCPALRAVATAVGHPPPGAVAPGASRSGAA